MIDWQLIETAPRDGTRVLLYVPKSLPDDKEWITFGMYGNLETAIWQQTDATTKKLVTATHSTQWFTPVGTVTPTHWMPEPEPPK